MSLDDLKNNLAREAHGMTKQEAHLKGVCISCKEPWEPKTHTELGRKEYQISAMCEECFDELFADQEDEYDDGPDEEFEEDLEEKP